MKSEQPVRMVDAEGMPPGSDLDQVLDRLSRSPVCGYRPAGPPATEPTALAAMVLSGGNRRQAAAAAAQWLTKMQSPDGSLGVTAGHPRPRWATGWAVIAWQLADDAFQRSASTGPERRSFQVMVSRWRSASERAVAWLTSLYGSARPRNELVGHDTTLRGWPWVDTTHSWVEPTAMNVLALKSVSLGNGPRVREAVRLLLDRMLPDGGWNQGNKMVLGRALRPHIQPTGLVLAALHGEHDAQRHVGRSLAYLQRVVSDRTATASLCHAVLGAAAHGVELRDAGRLLSSALRRTLQTDGSPYKLALLGMALQRADSPWLAS